jgi:glucokinase
METPGRLILAGDIGGTTTRLALFEMQRGAPVPQAQADYPSPKYPGLEAILAEFLKDKGAQIKAACFGVAGPVRQGRVETPNLKWVVDAASVARQIGIDRVELLNDLEATAQGTLALKDEDFEVLQAGEAEPQGNRAVIAAGTGLGEALLVHEAKGYRPLASEGGHADFAPRDGLEVELLLHLASIHGHVSYERVVSGPGLVSLYRFLRESGRGEEPEWLSRKLASEDPAPVIATAALEGTSPLCSLALDRFVSVYGAEAGNLALKVLATGGVYLGGGIAPKILPKLREKTFIESFLAKGRYRKLLEKVPVRVILNQRTALLGAALRGAGAA